MVVIFHIIVGHHAEHWPSQQHANCLPLHLGPIALLGSLKVTSSSIFLLVVTPSRSYLILRPKDKSDPDPKLATVLLHIWPLMILITLAELILLTLSAGLLGWLIFPALLLCFIFNYAVLQFFCRGIKAEGVVRDKLEQDPEEGVPETNDVPSTSLSKDTIEEENQHFIALAALSSIWLPSVVGHQSQRIFLVSGIVSLVTKVLLLAVAVTLADSGLQTKVYTRPFLLFCFDKNSTHMNETDVLKCTLSECLNETDIDPEKRFQKALAQLEYDMLEKYDLNITIIEDDLKAVRPEISEVFRNKLNVTSTLSGLIKLIKGEVEEILRSSGVGRVQQKIRICEDDEIEFQFRLGLLSGLLVVVALAAYATYKLHRIADYQVIEN